MATETIRHEWVTSDGKELGFNINIKGGCNMDVSFEYVCLTCKEHIILQHKRSEPMKGRKCTECEGNLARYHDKPPTLDADYHDSCRSYNIGWDE